MYKNYRTSWTRKEREIIRTHQRDINVMMTDHCTYGESVRHLANDSTVFALADWWTYVDGDSDMREYEFEALGVTSKTAYIVALKRSGNSREGTSVVNYHRRWYVIQYWL